MLGRLVLAAIASLGLACGDEVVGSESSATTTTSSTGAATTGGGGGGAEGGGGAGGCGAGGAPPCEGFHGCDPMALTDRTGEETVTIESGYIMSQFVYEPKCVLVSCGATVRFHIADGTSFSIH